MSQRKLSIREIFNLARGKKEECCSVDQKSGSSKPENPEKLTTEPGGCCGESVKEKGCC